MTVYAGTCHACNTRTMVAWQVATDYEAGAWRATRWHCAGCLRALLRDGVQPQLIGYATKHSKVERK